MEILGRRQKENERDHQEGDSAELRNLGKKKGRKRRRIRRISNHLEDPGKNEGGHQAGDSAELRNLGKKK